MYLLVLWLIPVLDGLPRSQKFQLGDRLQTTALDVLNTLVVAAYTHTRDRTALLRRARLGWLPNGLAAGASASGQGFGDD
jgi:hypothetical protein